MDWRFVDDEKWQTIHEALNGAGIESMQAKWDELFGVKEEVVAEGKVKKPRKKAAIKKKVDGDLTPELQGEKKPRTRKAATPKDTSSTASIVPKKTRAKKPKTIE
jgi:hypothetical protein